MELRRSGLALMLLAAALGGHAAQHRSSTAVAAFKRAQPCPATGLAKGACPGWIVDHVIQLCAGGPDEPANMQWQTVEDAKSKDRDERRLCRRR